MVRYIRCFKDYLYELTKTADVTNDHTSLAFCRARRAFVYTKRNCLFVTQLFFIKFKSQ